MQRFYVAGEIDDSVSISDTGQLHYLKDVLRLAVGDEVTVFDGRGNEYACEIRALNKKQAVLAVKARKKAKAEGVSITVACAIPKKSKMDDIIDNLTQLGVDVIIPMETMRVVVQLDESRRESRLKRWRKIAESAAQQSQRSTVPLIEPVASFESVVSRSKDFDLKLIPTLFGERKNIREIIGKYKGDDILFLIGPEGDFTGEEVELARREGFIPVSLGDSVLRVGTAAIAVASYIRIALDD